MNRKYFNFDTVLLIDGSLRFLKKKINYIKENSSENILAITCNHRMFNLSEKNFIKAEIDALNLNHLMFSIRSSVKKNILKLSLKREYIEKLRCCYQLFFLFHVLDKYKIKKVVLPQKYFLKFKIKKDEFYLLKKITYDHVEKLKNLFKKKGADSKLLTFFKISKINKNDSNLTRIIYLDDIKDTTDKFSLNTKQIKKSESDLFWIGFDNKFKDVPWKKKYKKDYWHRIAKNSQKEKPLFKYLKYCTRCCLPETWEDIKFDKFGICSICKSSEEKMNINWKIREKLLKKILYKNKQKNYYDCLLPISGGKDSTFQAYILKNVYNLDPLAITHGTNWMSLTGRYNLENCLNKFDLDHLIFHPNRSLVNHVANKSIGFIGDSCWHCHIGVGTFSIQTAIDWNFRLIVYGEAPADSDARGQHKKMTKISPFRFLEVSAIVKAKKFVSKDIDLKKLSHWIYPERKNIKNTNLEIIHLGQFIFWDEQKNIDLVVKKFGWKNTQVENTYKGYKSVECVMAGVHDYLNFLKRGIGRATVHASQDVRRGLIYRGEGFELAKKHDVEKPHAMEYYKKITKLSDNEISKKIIKARKNSKFASKLK